MVAHAAGVIRYGFSRFIFGVVFYNLRQRVVAFALAMKSMIVRSSVR